MRRFPVKPQYTLGDFVRIWNAFEIDARDRSAVPYEPRVWNDDSARRQLQKKGLFLPEPGGQGRLRTVTLEELRRAWPELLDSMLAADDHEEAVRAA